MTDKEAAEIVGKEDFLSIIRDPYKNRGLLPYMFNKAYFENENEVEALCRVLQRGLEAIENRMAMKEPCNIYPKESK